MGDLSIASGAWQPEIRWDTPAGIALDALLASLPPAYLPAMLTILRGGITKPTCVA